MEINVVVRSKGFIKINPDDYFQLKDGSFKGQDFSGKDVLGMSVINSHFENCLFERLRVDNLCFGEGKTMSTFVNCSFDDSAFFSPVVGRARFFNCTFRNVYIVEFRSYDAEFVNCIFSGKLQNSFFYGQFFVDYVNRLGMKTNEFFGNDFSLLEMDGVDFRCGIDLTKQKLPQGHDYLYVKDADFFIRKFQEKIKELHDDNVIKDAEIELKIACNQFNDGQKQFFLDRKYMLYETFDLMRQIITA